MSLAAYCTAEVRRRAQTSVFIGWTGTCGDALLQGGTSAAAQSTARESPRNKSLRWICRTSGGRAPGLSISGRKGRRHLARKHDCRERRREGPLHVCESALSPGRRRCLPNAAGGRRGVQAMLRLARVQTATLQGVPEVAARQGQAEKVAQIAFFATALFAAQLYLSPAQWFPVLEPLHHAAILSALGLAALMVRRVLRNQPLWMGWRSALLGVYAAEAVLSPSWSMDPHSSVIAAAEVAKHFLFF